MMRCRAITLLLSVLALASVGLFAGAQQPPKGPEPAKADTPGEVKKALLPRGWSKIGLTDVQKKELYKVRGRYQDQIKRLQEQIDALRAEERAELDKILTPGQKARLREVLTGEKPKDTKDTKDGKDAKDTKEPKE